MTHPQISIAIPAKNEAGVIERMLDAFVRQRDLQGHMLDPHCFELLVYANNCDDDTAGLTRAFAAEHPLLQISVVENTIDDANAHIGTARKNALDLVYARQCAYSHTDGIIASTDADSLVDEFWVAHTLLEMRSVDAVAGHVELSGDQIARLPFALATLYRSERTYRALLGQAAHVFDPRSFDPPARHDAFVGASFAVRTRAYRCAGGLPAVPVLEDLAFLRALERIDARVRHSYRVQVETSARLESRAQGGFGAFLSDLLMRGTSCRSYHVENAAETIRRFTVRHILRRLWSMPERVDALQKISEMHAIDPAIISQVIQRAFPLGQILAKLESSDANSAREELQPVEEAIGSLREAIACAIPSSATRRSAASGAG